LSGERKKSVSTPIKPCNCIECNSKGTNKSKKKKGNGEKKNRNKKKQTNNSQKNSKKIQNTTVKLESKPKERNLYSLNNEDEDGDDDDDDDDDDEIVDRHSIDEHQSEGGHCKSNAISHDLLPGSCSSCPSLCDHSQDYGYASAENNNHSNSTSSPDGSDVACSEGFCNHLGNSYAILTLFY